MQKRKRHVLVAGTVAITSIILLAVSQIEEDNIRKHTTQHTPQNSLNCLISNEDSNIEELRKLDKEIENYLAKYSLKGASLAITRNDSLLYAKGY